MASVRLGRLKWLTILAPLGFLALLELVRLRVMPALFATWPGYLVLVGIAMLAVLAFSQTIFSVIEGLQDRLRLRNHELLALHHATLSIAGQLELHAVLQRVVDEARNLFDARYGALSYLGPDGTIEEFITSGLSGEERRLIGPVPQGHGVLGIVIENGKPLRLDRIADHPRAEGFPPHHPHMQALLAVPIRTEAGVLGNLYIAESDEGFRFDQSDEQTLGRFAAVAAVAIENARLHRQVQALAIAEERQRIAREMHDSLAQVLGFVNTKAQAAQLLLEGGQAERASAQIAQLSDMARAAYADVREGILALRTSPDSGRGFVDALREFVDVWREQSGVPIDLKVTGLDDGLAPLVEVQVLRIVQEALANVRKHAAASQVHVRVWQDSGYLLAIVEDDGRGFAAEERGYRGVPRFGLGTMRERAESLGGSLDVSSQPGVGTRVALRVPVDP